MANHKNNGNRKTPWMQRSRTIDTWNTMENKDAKQHAGLMTATGEFYPELEAAIQNLSARMYEIAKRR
jgi:hypothetical protein